MLKWRPKFSLLTLLLFAICAGCGLLLWRSASPWQLERHIDLGHSQKELREGETEPFLRDYVKMAFSSDSRWMLLTAEPFKSGEDSEEPRELEVWDLQSASKVCVLKHDRKIQACAVSGDGNFVATMSNPPKDAAFYSELRIWMAQSGKLIATTPLKELYSRPPVYSSDNKRIIVGSCILDAASGKPLRSLANSFGFPCFPADIDTMLADERRNAAASVSATTLAEFEERTRKCFVNVVPSERWILTGTSSPGLSIWDVLTEKKAGTLNGEIDRHQLDSLRFSRTFSRVAITHKLKDDKTKSETLIVELPSGKVLDTIAGEIISSEEVPQCFSEDGTRLLFQLDAKTALWTEGEPPRKLPEDLLQPCSISPDGTRIAARKFDHAPQSVVVVDAQSLEPITELHYALDHGGFGVRFAGGDSIITHTDDNSLLIWRRNRPEKGGLAWLPQFWGLLAAIGLFGWSIFRDRRVLR